LLVEVNRPVAIPASGATVAGFVLRVKVSVKERLKGRSGRNSIEALPGGMSEY